MTDLLRYWDPCELRHSRPGVARSSVCVCCFCPQRLPTRLPGEQGCRMPLWDCAGLGALGTEPPLLPGGFALRLDSSSGCREGPGRLLALISMLFK